MVAGARVGRTVCMAVVLRAAATVRPTRPAAATISASLASPAHRMPTVPSKYLCSGHEAILSRFATMCYCLRDRDSALNKI